MALNLTTPHESGPEVTLPVLHPNDPIIKDPEIFDWLLFLPRDPIDFVGAFDSPVPTVAQYQDFLHHCETRARTLLRYLDNFEYKYRTIGLAYHQLPWAVRHSAHPETAHINTRLKQLFDTNTLRRHQKFFEDWYQVRDRAVDALTRTKLLGHSKDRGSLRKYYARTEVQIQSVEKLIPNIEDRLNNLDSLVNRTKNAAIGEDSVRGMVDLKWKYTKEGTSFRRWIYTFDEVDGMMKSGIGSVKVRAWAELLIQGWLDEGVNQGVEWSDVEV